MRALRIGATEASASVADLGTILPIAAALVLTNGIDPVAAFGFAGVLFVLSGLYYRLPVPVQPIKAAAAIAIATHASPRVIAAAGLLIGAILVAISLLRLAPLLVRIFPKPVIRGNQLGVGLLLVITAVGMVRRAPGSDVEGLAVAAAAAVLLALTRERRAPVALALVAGGVAWSIVRGGTLHIEATFALPSYALPSSGHLATAFTLLVIPQLPLTLGNAIVGTADVERDYFGERAHRVTPAALALSSGLANAAVGVFGGMPLCHGSSGATAYHRFGARTGGVNLVLGGALIVLGVLFGGTALDLFALIPAPILGALLAYTGLRHAVLVTDQRGFALLVAVSMGIVGAVTRNLAWAMAVGVPAAVLLSAGRRARARK